MNLLDLEKDFLKFLQQEQKSLNTIKNYRHDFSIYKQFLGLKRQNFEFRPPVKEEILEYERFLKERYPSTNTQRRRIQCLRLFYDYLISRNIIGHNPIKHMSVAPKLIQSPKPVHIQDIKTLWAYFEKTSIPDNQMIAKLIHERNRLLFIFIYLGGLRVSQISLIQNQHIIIGKKEIRVMIEEKDKDPFTIILPLSIKNYLSNYIQLLGSFKASHQREFASLFFHANAHNAIQEELSPRGIEITFKEISRQTKTRVTARSLRYSAILRWLGLNYPPARIKEWMGVRPEYSLAPYQELLQNHPDKFTYPESLNYD